MSAAEKLPSTRRQRRRDALVMACTAFANRLADILDEGDIAEDDNTTTPRRRRVPQRVAYVPTHDQMPSPEAMAEAQRAARRAGIR